MKLLRREPTLKELNSEAQTLMNFLMDKAQERLKSLGGFRPFGASMAEDGVVSLMTGQEIGQEAAEMPAGAMVERLTGRLRAMSETGGLRAAGLAADMRFGKQDSGELADAVRLHIEHRDGYCADIFVPYKIRSSRRKPAVPRRLRFSHPVAQESDRRFWVVAEDVN